MRILFCDDNPEILRQLQQYVSEFFRELGGVQPEYAVYSSGDALLARETKADLAFLDVEMAGRTGIQTGAELKKRNPYIKIFIVTAFSDYLDEAMHFQVFRYLTKPIDKVRLFRNLRDAVAQYHMDTHTYPILTDTGVTVCRAEELVCVEARHRRTRVYTLGGVLNGTESIGTYRERLTLPCFYTPHRSYILNMRFVKAIQRDSVLLQYGGETKQVYLARRKYAAFKDAFLLYLGGRNNA